MWSLWTAGLTVQPGPGHVLQVLPLASDLVVDGGLVAGLTAAAEEEVPRLVHLGHAVLRHRPRQVGAAREAPQPHDLCGMKVTLNVPILTMTMLKLTLL